MLRAPYLLLIPVFIMALLLPFAARGVAPPFLPFTPALFTVLQGLVGWILIWLAALGLARRWRITRVIIVFTAAYFLLPTIYYLLGGQLGWPRLLVRFICYGFVALLAWSFAPALRKAP